MDLQLINEIIKYAAEKHGREILLAQAAYLEVEESPHTGKTMKHLNLVGTDAMLYARIERHLRKRLGVDYIHSIKADQVRPEWERL